MGDSTMTINFILQPDNLSHVVTFSADATVQGVKETLEADLRIPTDKLKLVSTDVGELSDEQILSDCGLATDSSGQVTLHVTVEDDGAEAYRMPDSWDVVVRSENPDVPPKRITITVERAQGRKPYLGGFRNKRTGAIYHHGSTQTARGPRTQPEDRKEAFHRETQTLERKTRSVQLPRSTGTQMDKRGVHVSSKGDKVLTPGPYFSSEMLAELKLQKTVVIQCYYRSYRSRLAAAEKRQRIADRLAKLDNDEKRAEAARARRRNREIERRMHPRTRGDFEVLYNELESWRFHESKRIREATHLSERERRLELAELLAKETKLLQTIDKLKSVASKENREKRIQKMLALMSAPKKWELQTGEVSEVHTPFTTRARELAELYNGLRRRPGTTEERLDVLLHVKWTAKEFDCNLTRDLVELIDREADLLNRGRSEKTLLGLRKRIENLFLSFLQTPEFNPEAARFQRVPRDIMKEVETAPK
jgi:hypothetical protein